MPSLLRRLTLCRLGMCPFRTASNDEALWGQCTIPGCGKRSGYITREAVRRYAEAQERMERIEAEHARKMAEAKESPLSSSQGR